MLITLFFVLLFVGLMIILLYAIPIPRKDILDLYKGDKFDLEALLTLRTVPQKTITINKINWEYLSIGQGDKHLLFLHGLGGDYSIWWQQINFFSKNYHIISTTLPEVYSLDEAIEGIRVILDKERIEKISVIGSSMGGYMFQYFLKKYPERLDKVVFGNTFSASDLMKKQYMGIRRLIPLLPAWLLMKRFRVSLLKSVLPTSENSPLLHAYLAEQYWGKMRKNQIISRLDVVLDDFKLTYSAFQKSIPKLIIESDNDPLMYPILRQKLRELYPEAKVHTFINKGHFPYVNDSKNYNDVLHSFLIDES